MKSLPSTASARCLRLLAMLLLLTGSFVACRPDSSPFTRHYILARDGHPALPPVALQLPDSDITVHVTKPTQDSVSVAWLRPFPVVTDHQKEQVPLFLISSASQQYFCTIFYPRPGGLYSKDSSFTAYMYLRRVTPDTVLLEASSLPYIYIRKTGEWFFNNPRQRLQHVPPIRQLNQILSHYIDSARKHDSNTLVRFGVVPVHRIYHYGDQWYMANYTCAGIDIYKMRRSEDSLGPRFDFASYEEQKAIFRLTRQPFMKNGRSLDENFLRNSWYYRLDRKGSVYRINRGTKAVEDTLPVQKGWQYNYSFYDSIFYFGGPRIDSIFRF